MSRERTGRPSVGGIPFKACLFFAAHPDRELTTSQIADVLDLPSNHVCSTLVAVVAAGFISKRLGGWRTGGGGYRTGGDGREETRYMAGPRILEVIGAAPPEEPDEDAIVQTVRPAGTWERQAKGLAPAQWHEAIAA